MPTEALPPRATVAAELVAARDALLTAEQAVLEATLRLHHVRCDLQDAEDAVRPTLEGKNERDRAAETRGRTMTQRRWVEEAEDARLRAASALEQARVTWSTAKVLARLVVGE